MYEHRLKKISGLMEGGQREDYFVLSYKGKGREIYFRNTSEAIKFMGIKFNPELKKVKKDRLKKKIAYFLIKARLLQIFLKKIKLNPQLGDVIFVAGQVKGFDLNKKKVYSFPLRENFDSSFMYSKEAQRVFSLDGFAPKIICQKKKKTFFEEELLAPYTGGDDERVFRRLISFYKKKGISKVSRKYFISNKKKRLRNEGLLDKRLEEALEKISLKTEGILVARTHGDFAKGQVLTKDGSYVFTDWYSGKNLLEKDVILKDLVRFFGREKDLSKNPEFQKLLRLYPKEVQEEVESYIILSDIDLLLRKGSPQKFLLERISYLSQIS